MIKLRLQRKGRIRRPIYHIVVADSRSSRDGRIIEQVGRYDNVSEKKEVVLNEDRILYWLQTGAQPTDTVRSILRNEGVLYKRHLIMWGKSEEEIEAAMAEWSAYRQSKADSETTRKTTYKDVLAAEEKEYKKAVAQKSTVAAKQLEEEKAEAEAEVAEEAAEEAANEELEAAVEEAKEAVAESAETTAEEVAETVAEEVSEEKEEASATEKKSDSSAVLSTDMTAKEAADHIKDTSIDKLADFVPESEERKTVLAAWEAKQAE